LYTVSVTNAREQYLKAKLGCFDSCDIATRARPNHYEIGFLCIPHNILDNIIHCDKIYETSKPHSVNYLLAIN